MSRNHPDLATPVAQVLRRGATDCQTPLHIVVLGSGYVGLVTAVCMARFGHEVTAIDRDDAKVRCLQRGEVTIHEEGLADALGAELAAGRLRFATEPEAVRRADIVFLAVGTPSRGDGSACLQALDYGVAQIAPLLRPEAVVVIKSTVPVGTAGRIQATLRQRLERAPDGIGRDRNASAAVLNNPEFLREGTALADFLAPDRIIVGAPAGSEAAQAVLLQAYRSLIDQGTPVLTMDCCSAELSKCAANAMLATRISFINEIAAIAAATGADIERVRDGIGSDRRIGRAFLQAGLGYGGSCFRKDVAALRHAARVHGLRSDTLHATERVNDRQRMWAFDAFQRDLGGVASLRGLRVAIWGLAFKPGTDDMRDAPSLAVIERLLHAGVFVQLYDPVALANARALLSPDRRMSWAASAAAALAGTDALMLVTDWPEFMAFDPRDAAHAVALHVVYDGRNALDAVRWTAAGMRVVQVGRGVGGRPGSMRRKLVVASDAVPV